MKRFHRGTIHRPRLIKTHIWRNGVLKKRFVALFSKGFWASQGRETWPALLSLGALSEATKSAMGYVSPMQSTERKYTAFCSLLVHAGFQWVAEVRFRSWEEATGECEPAHPRSWDLTVTFPRI